mmetsp:Transcript_28490/g.88624  ORF Transcript_28490/g.88624 Transcript_28490/m.88624 type:complete len:566 (-) Transcript_28490:188-1885(-)
MLFKREPVLASRQRIQPLKDAPPLLHTRRGVETRRRGDELAGPCSLRSRLGLAADDVQDSGLQLLVVRDRRELWVLPPQGLRGAVQDALLRGPQHLDVVEGAAHGDDAEVQALELLHGLQLLVLQPGDQLVHVAVLVGLEVVAEDHGVPQPVEDGQGVLLEAVRDHEGARQDGLEPLEEVGGPGQHVEVVHDVEDLPELHAVAAEGGGAERHEPGVVRLLRGGHLQLLDAEPRLHGQPGLGGQEAGDVAAEQPHRPGGLGRAQGRRGGQGPGHDLLVRAKDAADLDAEVVVVLGDRKLWVRLLDLLRGVDEDAVLRRLHHRNVVEGIANSNDSEVQTLERLDGLSLLVLQPQAVADDEAVRIYDEGVAEDGGVPKLLEHGHGVLLEGVREEQDAGHQGLQPLEEFPGAGQRLEVPDDLQHVLQPDVVLPQQVAAVLHELVVVGLVRRRPLQALDARLLLQREPRLGHEGALDVEGAHDGVPLGDLHVLVREDVLGLQVAQHGARADVRVQAALIVRELTPMGRAQVVELPLLVVPVRSDKDALAALVAPAEVLLQFEEVLLPLLP